MARVPPFDRRATYEDLIKLPDNLVAELECPMPRTRTGQAPATTTVKRAVARRLAADEKLTPAERRSVALGRRDLASGDFVTLKDLRRELGGSSGRARGPRPAGGAPAADRLRLLTALHGMEGDPFTGDVHRLRGQPCPWRRRVGDWRILYSLDRAARVVDIAAIVRRSTTTY